MHLDQASEMTLFSSLGKIVPILTIHHQKVAAPLVSALLAGGIKAVEVTLRTPIALNVITELRQAFPEMIIGAGTVMTPDQLAQSVNAGAQFAFSPGHTRRLLEAGKTAGILFVPGVASFSECMDAAEFGYECFKFFPADSMGESVLKAWYGPGPRWRFCATGGLDAANFSRYLQLPNVLCVGGTWMISEETLAKEDWLTVTKFCQTALALT
ncbi:MAG: bifunctional 4-hydroxy-2-oxoglutarate aldolase/2-dehydro-3-deoxy-phosphogluconate aldolase [Legionella sp.]|nr:bifunctional 4-hydroxy-2-oxoglutarate aldolase/2-dehydro-3-deoxy-phosphogluconate aldolase [Legionella sp.]